MTIKQMLMTEEEIRIASSELFKQESDAKEELRQKGRKDEHGDERPVLPWTLYDMEYLIKHFREEVRELEEAILSNDAARIADECCDVRNFAKFIWASARMLPLD